MLKTQMLKIQSIFSDDLCRRIYKFEHIWYLISVLLDLNTHKFEFVEFAVRTIRALTGSFRSNSVCVCPLLMLLLHCGLVVIIIS